MGLAKRLVALLSLASALGLAATWSGALVDANCFRSLENNKNPQDSLSSVDRDRGAEIVYCTPTLKTKSFAVVILDSGISFKLDPSGDAKAAELVREIGRHPHFMVDVSGEMSKHTIKVDSITTAR